MVLIGVDGSGRSINLPMPREIFLAFRHFLSPEEPSGSLIVHFKHGSVAGVETNTKQVLK